MHSPIASGNKGGTFTMVGLMGVAAAVLMAFLLSSGLAQASNLACDTQPVTIATGSSNDIIYGTPGNDVIHAGDGDDIIYGLGGDDVICGGLSNDTIYGGEGNDRLFGYAGAYVGNQFDEGDTIFGGPGDDYINGNAGGDEMHGGDGNDVIFAGDDESLNFMWAELARMRYTAAITSTRFAEEMAKISFMAMAATT